MKPFQRRISWVRIIVLLAIVLPIVVVLFFPETVETFLELAQSRTLESANADREQRREAEFAESSKLRSAEIEQRRALEVESEDKRKKELGQLLLKRKLLDESAVSVFLNTTSPQCYNPVRGRWRNSNFISGYLALPDGTSLFSGQFLYSPPFPPPLVIYKSGKLVQSAPTYSVKSMAQRLKNGSIALVTENFGTSTPTLSIYKPHGGLDVTATNGIQTQTPSVKLVHSLLSGEILVVGGKEAQRFSDHLSKFDLKGNLVAKFQPQLEQKLTFIEGLATDRKGRLWIAGRLATGGSQPKELLYRLQTDGSTDPAFAPSSEFSLSNGKILIFSNGKRLVYKNGTYRDGGSDCRNCGAPLPRYKATLYRVLENGTKDPKFREVEIDSNISQVVIGRNDEIHLLLIAQPAGKYIGLNKEGEVISSKETHKFTSLSLSDDGTLYGFKEPAAREKSESSIQVPVYVKPNVSAPWKKSLSNIKIVSGQPLVVAGAVVTSPKEMILSLQLALYEESTFVPVTRVLPNGCIDNSFPLTLKGEGLDLAFDSNKKVIWFVGDLTDKRDSPSFNSVAQFNEKGHLLKFVNPTDIPRAIGSENRRLLAGLKESGALLVEKPHEKSGELTKIAATGVVDPTFNLDPQAFILNPNMVQGSNKNFYGCGWLTSDQKPASLMSFSKDGKLIGVSPTLSCSQVHESFPDQLLIYNVAMVAGKFYHSLHRSNYEMKEDPTFSTNANRTLHLFKETLLRISSQADGKIILVARDSGGPILLRLNADGTRDETFLPPRFSGTQYPTFGKVIVNHDQIMILGNLEFGSQRFGAMVLNLDGSLRRLLLPVSR